MLFSHVAAMVSTTPVPIKKPNRIKYHFNIDYHLLICCSLAIAVYANTLNAGFVYDDNQAIIANEDIRPSTPGSNIWWNDFWGTPMGTENSHGSYRPITVLSYRLNYRWSGLRASSYHATNVALHGLATGLVLIVARTVSCRRAALMSASLFAVHPVHADAVASVVGRADVLSCVFFLLSFLCYGRHVRARDGQRHRHHHHHHHRHQQELGGHHRQPDHARAAAAYLAFCVLFALLSMLAKENGISVMAVCIVYELMLRLRSIKSNKVQVDKDSSWKTVKVLMTSAAVMVAGRLCVMSGTVPTFATSDNPAAKHPDPVVRTLTFLHLPVVNARLLVWPHVLSYDWSMDAVPRVESAADPRNAATAMFYAALAAVARSAVRRKRAAVTVAAAVSVASYVPASNALFYVGFVVAERVLYIPSVGYCLLVGCSATALARWADGRRRCPATVVYALYVATVVLYGFRTVIRNRDWCDEESLYRSGIQVNPPKSYGNLGSILSSQGRTNEAEIAYRSALKHRPNMAEVHYNLGNLLRYNKKYDEAISSYRSAIHFRPTLALAYLSLGDCLATTNQHAEAEVVLNKCLTLDGSKVKDIKSHKTAKKSCVIRLGKMFVEIGEHQKTVQLFKSIIKSEGSLSQTMLYALADSLSVLGKDTEAEMYYKQLLQVNPTDVSAFLTYGDLLAKNRSRISEAEEWYGKAHRTAPNDPVVRTRYADFLSAVGRLDEAVDQYEAAAALASDDHQIAVKTATALREAGRTSESETYYRRAATLYPQDAASHSNLGAILHINNKLDEAERSYKNALRLQPDDATTLANLRKLRNVHHRRTVK
ncbi:transmembrane and TPR repeat-containing protein CG4341-like [Sipha flava]|uniref:dolichyl-phosphate-mannose--protein mannosyltransferase n=1 Tax=Sipha flava TaxID=143950 RepID=A0A8B8FQS2_9HEMI|nr:transmembrane and TPR repeat-containing protein CG4341-like [Sipha flava]